MNAKDYMKHWEEKQVWTHYKWAKHQQRFKQIAVRLKGSTCLDVGCCYGHSTRILAVMYRAKWTGLEFVKKAVDKAKVNFPKIEFVYSKDYDFEINLKGRKFDSIICSEIFEHIENDREFLEQIMKIKNIKVIITTPNRFVDDPGHLRIYNGESIDKLCKGYDYIIKSIGPFYYVEVS